jgi:organic hydroperoxide reductase OsmC/OhrA
MDKIKPLFSATATAIGGRNGHTESSDGVVAADLSLPKEMGGAGKPGTATPEHLFAAGYPLALAVLSTPSENNTSRIQATPR